MVEQVDDGQKMAGAMSVPDIARLPKHHPAQLTGVTHDPGVYIWWHRSTGSPAYIGAALNRQGLCGRVGRQHLCPTYLELRSHKTAAAPVVALYKGREAAEKSVFRKAVSRKHGLPPGQACVEFIKANFLVSLIPLPGVARDVILGASELIQRKGR